MDLKSWLGAGVGKNAGTSAAAANGRVQSDGPADLEDSARMGQQESSSPAPRPPAHKRRRLILTSSSGSIAATTALEREASPTSQDQPEGAMAVDAELEDVTMADPMSARPPARRQITLDGRPVQTAARGSSATNGQSVETGVSAPPFGGIFGQSSSASTVRAPRASAARASATISSALKDEAAEIAAMKAAAAAAAKSKRQQEREIQAAAKASKKQQRKVNDLATNGGSGYGTGSEADPTDVDALPERVGRSVKAAKHAKANGKHHPASGGKKAGADEIIEIVEVPDDGSSPLKSAEPPRPRKTYESVMGKIAGGRSPHPFFGGGAPKRTGAESDGHEAVPVSRPEAEPTTNIEQQSHASGLLAERTQSPKPPQLSNQARLGTTGVWQALMSAGQQNLRTGWGSNKEPAEPRWPLIDEQIVSPHRPPSAPSGRQRQRSVVPTTDHEEHEFWRAIAPKPLPVSAPPRSDAQPSSVFPYIAAHPAFTRGLPAESGTHELLVDRLRPRRAAEVLGNESEARYLVEWMKELAIAAPGAVVARKDVTRRVIKGRGRPANRVAPDDDWIVDDEDPIEERTPEPASQESQTQDAPSQDFYPPFSRRLANSILLHGPSGSGKTAAVHAATAELDWEIFEVNPGMGKRTGAQLLELVGDVGKNHTLSGAGPAKEHKGALRQSIILLEEVDILYEEDKGFWAGAIALIAESRRPVVMTCNDLDLIPFEELALQTTLLFDRPPSYLTIPYLESISGNAMPGLATASRINLVEQRATPSTSRLVTSVDLRQALMQLQAGLQAPRPGAPPPQDLASAHRELNLCSYSDAWIESDDALIAVHEIDRNARSADDEVEARLLVKPRPSRDAYTSALPGREREIAEQLHRGEHSRHDALTFAQARYLADSLAFLDPVIPLDGHLLPSACVFTDIIPAILAMIRIDDQLEREDADALANGVNRTTGRMVRATATSMHAPYVRQMSASDDMGERGLQVARRLAVWA